MNRTTFVGAVMLVVTSLSWTPVPVNGQKAAAPTSTEVDISALAGKWEGWWLGPESAPLEVIVKADGTYVSRLGADSGSGTFRVVNGVIVAEGRLSGADAPRSDRVVTVTLVQKNGASILMGDGRTSAGPYSFTLTK